MNMIDQAKEKRLALEEAIQQLSREFEDETGLYVTEIKYASGGFLRDIKIEVILSRCMSSEWMAAKEKEYERKREEQKVKTTAVCGDHPSG